MFSLTVLIGQHQQCKSASPSPPCLHSRSLPHRLYHMWRFRKDLEEKRSSVLNGVHCQVDYLYRNPHWRCCKKAPITQQVTSSESFPRLSRLSPCYSLSLRMEPGTVKNHKNFFVKEIEIKMPFSAIQTRPPPSPVQKPLAHWALASIRIFLPPSLGLTMIPAFHSKGHRPVHVLTTALLKPCRPLCGKAEEEQKD